eukprot:Filipodium_phascolosomae@DN2773_c0_g1_i12.p1
MKNGKLSEVVTFVLYVPHSAGRLFVTVPADFSIPADCKAVLPPAPEKYRNLEITSCSVEGREATLTFTGVPPKSVNFTPWNLFGLKVNVPLVPYLEHPWFPDGSFLFEIPSAQGARTSTLRVPPIEAVKGSRSSITVGGDEYEAVMRPLRIASNAVSEATFLLTLHTSVKLNGSIVVTPPAGFTLPEGRCDSEEVNAFVGDCFPDHCQSEGVSRIVTRGINWQCAKKGNSISLKRVI